MAELALFITVRTKSGRRDELRKCWERYLEHRAADNNEQSSYRYAFDMNDENIIRIAEVYETISAFQTNADSKWFEAYMREAAPLLYGEPEFHMAEPKWVK